MAEQAEITRGMALVGGGAAGPGAAPSLAYARPDGNRIVEVGAPAVASRTVARAGAHVKALVTEDADRAVGRLPGPEAVR